MTVLKLIRKACKRFRNLINHITRFFAFKKIRKTFQNKSLSVFSSNCVGCLMLHDLGVAFNSPFVNLFINAKDYIKYLLDPQKYNEMTFREVESQAGYPVGMLGDLTFHFVHSESFEKAVADFERRVKRIRYDNLFVIFTERDGCTYQDLETFDALPYKNKIVFTHLPYEDIQSAFYIEGFEQDAFVGDIIKWDKKLGKKIYDRFDFVKWFDQRP